LSGTYGRYGGEVRCVQGLVGKHKGKRKLGRHRHRWDINTEMIFQQWDGRLIWQIGTGGRF